MKGTKQMPILNVDTTDTKDLLKRRTFDPIPPDTYQLEIAKPLTLEESKSTPGNQVVNIELVVVSEGEFKGRRVFDNLVICQDPEKRKKTEWKIAQFAVATGLYTSETIKDGIDLDIFHPDVQLSAKVGVTTNTYQGETKKKNVVKEYLFEREEE